MEIQNLGPCVPVIDISVTVIQNIDSTLKNNIFFQKTDQLNFLIDFSIKTKNVTLLNSLLKKNPELCRAMINDVTNLYWSSVILSGNLEMVKTLIRGGADLKKNDESKNKLADLAVMANNVEILKELINAGVDINLVGDYGTPLSGALIQKNYEIAKVLIEAGGDVNKMDRCGYSPLNNGIRSGNEEIAIALIEAKNTNLNQIDIYGINAVYAAVQAGNLKIVKLLIRKNADFNKPDNHGKTPLYVAAKNGKWEIIIYLISLGADVNKGDQFGKTPIYIATESNSLTIVKLLIAEGADVDKAYNDGTTSLSIAVAGRSLAIVKVLLAAGADASKAVKALRILKEGRTQGHKEILQLFMKQYPDLKLQIQEERHRLAVSHAFHIRGMTTLSKIHSEKISKNIDLKLEGAYGAPGWFRLMSKNFHFFKQAYPHLLSDERASLLIDTLNFAAEIPMQNSTSISKRMEAGLPIIVTTGYENHLVTILIWNDQIVICNRGGASRRPMEIFRFSTGVINAEAIIKIMKIKNLSKKFYENFLNFLVPPDFKQNDLDYILQFATTLPSQVVGNCSWVSAITAVFAMMLIGGVRGEHKGRLGDDDDIISFQELEERIEAEVNLYRTWIAFQQVSSLERLMKPIKEENLHFKPDHRLILTALRSANLMLLDNFLSNKLQSLTGTYMQLLTPDECHKLKTYLEIWKNSDREAVIL